MWPIWAWGNVSSCCRTSQEGFSGPPAGIGAAVGLGSGLRLNVAMGQAHGLSFGPGSQVVQQVAAVIRHQLAVARNMRQPWGQGLNAPR
ncbi:hypothetical protein ELY33_08505 [Vreelandella andesensis]|uniref:Uncharacterized protein n=1 Tax=Vreelandella andesensis TaxID=447567 RepID=A0A3S0WJR2_9GAMM|nr:hypothetical protein [Halomonas andesensis]RUR30843.1 hypothetical protein ELY33_08505 [Halomonas andesensis]